MVALEAGRLVVDALVCDDLLHLVDALPAHLAHAVAGALKRTPEGVTSCQSAGHCQVSTTEGLIHIASLFAAARTAPDAEERSSNRACRCLTWAGRASETGAREGKRGWRQ